MAAPFAMMMVRKNVVIVVAVVLLVMPLVVHYPTAVRVVHALDGDSSVVRVGSGIFPVSASAQLGALANVTLSQAGANEPVSINVTYDDTSSFRGAMGAFKVHIAAEPLDRIDAGGTVAECLTLPMYDPNEQAPPFVSLSVYVQRGCDGEADMIMMGEDDNPDHDDTQVAAREKACALGDLSGKHGLLPAPKGTHTFEDRSITNLNEIVGLSFIMVNDESRTVACANIVMDVDDDYKPPFEEPPSETSRLIDLRSSSSQCSIPVPQCTSGQLSEDVPRIISPEPDEVKRGVYPWIVYMGSCSGTLIAPTVVLTAAHCVMPHGPIRMRSVVYIGCHLLNQGCQESRLVTDVYAHEKYTQEELYSSETDDGKPRQKFAYDVAVLILDRPSRMSVAKLATRDDDPAYCEKSASTVAGWGRDTKGARSEVLLQVEVPVTSHESCEKEWGKGRIGPTMICAGFDDGGCDACQGDSGGPIFTSTRCAPQGTPARVFGIVSWGSKCEKENRKPYGVYTSVTSVRDWIASKMPGGELDDPDERELPYVVRAIDMKASDSTLCAFLDNDSRCAEDEVKELCPKLCGGSCPLVQNVKSTTITPPQTTTSSSSTTTAPPTMITPPQTTTSSSTTTAPPTIITPPQTTTSSSTTTAPPDWTQILKANTVDEAVKFSDVYHVCVEDSTGYEGVLFLDKHPDREGFQGLSQARAIAFQSNAPANAQNPVYIYGIKIDESGRNHVFTGYTRQSEVVWTQKCTWDSVNWGLLLTASVGYNVKCTRQPGELKTSYTCRIIDLERARPLVPASYAAQGTRPDIVEATTTRSLDPTTATKALSALKPLMAEVPFTPTAEQMSMLNASSEADVAQMGETGSCERVSNRNEVYQLYARKRPEKRGFEGWTHAVARWYYQGSSRTDTDTEGVAYYSAFDEDSALPFYSGKIVVFMSDDKGNVRKSTCRFILRNTLVFFASGRSDTWRCEGDWLNEDLLCRM
ncbi:peptidase S1 domain-containing protein [Pycnococcus provasolii]